MNSQIITIPEPHYAAGTLVELRDSPGVLKRFLATPKGIVCPHFWRLSLGIGCSIGCQYCYLQGHVTRGFRMPDAPPVLFMDTEGMQALVEKFLRKSKPQVLNVGELTDCYDDQTEILTSDGWIAFEELTIEHEVATLNPETHYLEYHKPDRVIKRLYNGPMIEVQKKTLNFCVTTNHKVYIAPRKTRRDGAEYQDFRLVRIREVVDKRLKFKKNCHWSGNVVAWFYLPTIPHARYKRDRQLLAIPMLYWLEFLGYYLAEGHASHSQIIIAQQPGEKREKIKACLDLLPFKYQEVEDGFRISSVRLAKYLRPLGKAHQKYVPEEYKQLDSQHLQVLVNAMMLGDGSRGYEYYTSSKRLADDFQEVLLKVGLSGSISLKHEEGRPSGLFEGLRRVLSKHRLYTVYITHSQGHNEPVLNNGKDQGAVQRIQYHGKIYCCEVKNHIIYVRRNGKPVWSGNSLLFDDFTGILSWMIPMFGEQKIHKLLCLSKVANTRHLYDLKHNGQTIMSWSIQGPGALNRGYEGIAPHTKVRLQAAKKCQDAGYPVRLRIDPLIPTPDWSVSYSRLIGWVSDAEVKPERWTLGSLRFFTSARILADEELETMVKTQGDPDRRYRVDVEQRIRMYRDVINFIRAWFPEPVIGLCKETEGVWKVIQGLYSNQVLSDQCNCTL